MVDSALARSPRVRSDDVARGLGVRPEPALAPAMLRISVVTALLLSPELWQAPRWAALPVSLQYPPEGLGWVLEWIPVHVGVARGAQLALVAGCVFALLGVFARTALALSTIAALYVFGLAQLSGAVIHDMHLLWFAALLALTPCGDALSLERWWQKRSPPGASEALAYGVAPHFTRVLLGLVYFFPGFWKLTTSGLAWVSGDNLRNQLYWKWYQLGVVPELRLDRVPGLLNIAAVAVVVFELGFIALIWSRRGRLLAVVSGTLFHVSVRWFMGVSFMSLLFCYVALLDWRPLAARLSRAVSPPPSAAHSNLPVLIVGACLVAIMIVQGARHAVQAWPFGCYPTFDQVLGAEILDLRIEAVGDDATARAMPDGPSTRGRRRTAQDWARAWQLAGLYGTAADPRQLQAYFRLLTDDPQVRAAARTARSLRFYVAAYSVLPERQGEAPVRKQLLFEWLVPAGAARVP